jgi:hypothetical protein
VTERQHLHEHWDRVERELRAALALVRHDLSPGNVELVEEFLHHNELGLAFDFIVDELLERDAKPSQPAFDHLQRAANEMEVSNDARWSRFANRFANPSQ